jgi:hypothetical protein
MSATEIDAASLITKMSNCNTNINPTAVYILQVKGYQKNMFLKWKKYWNRTTINLQKEYKILGMEMLNEITYDLMHVVRR